MQIGTAAHGEVVGFPAAPGQRLHGLGFQRQQVGGGRASRSVAQQAQGFGQLGSFLPLLGVQVAVAGRQGQAVLSPLGFPSQNVNRQGELLHHAAYHHDLLVVLLAEGGHPGGHARKHA